MVINQKVNICVCEWNQTINYIIVPVNGINQKVKYSSLLNGINQKVNICVCKWIQ